jgi:uncharacterized protein (DUF2062 family)
MGIVPLWGFQMVIAIALAFAFRLNKTLVIIAANISIPPMIPVVLYLSHLTGRLWMGEKAQAISFNDEITLELIHTNFIQYVYGATTLAAVAGLLNGGITYAALRLGKRKKRRQAL